MPYKTVSGAKRAGFKTTLKKAKLTLAQINSIARCYDDLKRAGKVRSPMAVCINAFYKTHKKSKGRWVRKKKTKK